MAVTVIFRGIILFVTKEGKVVRAYLPATTCPAPGESKCGKHFDGSKATEHFAGLLHWSNGMESNYPLHGNKVAFKLGVDKHRIAETHIKDMADLRRPKYSPFGDLVLREQPGASFVEMVWPVLPRVEAPTDTPMKFQMSQGGHPVVHRLELSFDVPQIVKINNSTPAIELQDGDELYVYNADRPNPDREYLKATRELDEHVNMLYDHDFKWLYSLTRPKHGSFEEWAADGLPCPTWWKPAIADRVVSVSTCFPARIDL